MVHIGVSFVWEATMFLEVLALGVTHLGFKVQDVRRLGVEDLGFGVSG